MPLDGSGNHFWSVNAEEQFYLVAPILIVVAAPAIGRSVVTWLAISAFLWWFFNLYASITLGVTAAVIASRYGSIHLKMISRVLLVIVTAATAWGMIAGYDHLILSPPFSIAIVLLLALKGRPTRLGTVAGGISYPLYLNHWLGPFVAHAVIKRTGPTDSIPSHILSVTFSLVFAYVMFQLVDRPVLKHRSMYYTPARGRIATIIAYGLVILGLVVGFAITMS
jgi:peptidoglycan/LPS O-acetylase OafA/YrhL